MNIDQGAMAQGGGTRIPERRILRPLPPLDPTPEMVDAGVEAMRDLKDCPERFLVAEIYLSMVGERPSGDVPHGTGAR